MALGPLTRVIVHVDDMAAEVAFYRETLGLVTDAEHEMWTTFVTGACTLALHGGGRIGSNNARLNFSVADLDAERAELGARGVELTETREPAPGVRVADLHDPEGNLVSLEERS